MPRGTGGGRPPGTYEPDSLRTRIARVLADGRPRTVYELAQALPGVALERIKIAAQTGTYKGRFVNVGPVERRTPHGVKRLAQYAIAEVEARKDDEIDDEPVRVIRQAQAGEVTGQARQWWQT